MTRKQRYSSLVGASIVVMALMVLFVWRAMQDQMVFFYSPSDVLEKKISIADNRIRLGGMVEAGSLEKSSSSLSTRFILTDLQNSLTVEYTGILPDLFGEGQGVVAEGRMTSSEVFKASMILAKHDADYVPREVVGVLRKAERNRVIQ